MAPILAQLLALCVSLGGNKVAYCQNTMIQCVQKHYSQQHGDVSDICTKEYLKEEYK